MNWFFIWKVVLAAAAIIVSVNALTLAAKTTRDAFQEWNTSRGILRK
jgi:hypothetical protein